MGGDCSTLKSCNVPPSPHALACTFDSPLPLSRMKGSTGKQKPDHRDIPARSQSKVLELVTVRDYPATAASFLIVD